MKYLLLLLFPVCLVACKKNNGNGQGSPPVDTLATGWRRIPVAAINGNDIFFINNNVGYGLGGTNIHRSTDGGNTFQHVYHCTVSLINIAMGNTNNAIFVTQYPATASKLIITQDGGNHFDSVTIADSFISDAFFVSPTVAYAVGKKFWKTINGGLNWTMVADLGAFAPDGYMSLYFITDQTGWIATPAGIYKTTNGGVNWNPLATTGFDFTTSGGSVFFTDVNTGYISDFQGVGKSSNGGTSWNRVFNFPGYHDIHFVTADIGYVSAGNHIYKTINGGVNWTMEVSVTNNGDIGINELHFTDANHGWASCTLSNVLSGVILKYER